MSRIFLSPPDVGPLERQMLLDALDSGWVAPVGPDLTAFEAAICEITGWPGAVALSSGSAALHLALLGVGVGPGDEVLVSTFTFSASANPVRYCGASPVFVDSDDISWNMSPSLLHDELSERRRRNRLPRAVVVVDLYGQCADYDAIVPLCHDLEIPIVEDAAEALLASYRGRPAGTLGDVGVFSFNGNKVMTTSGGGMLVAPSTAVAARARHLATQAREPVPHYEHVDVGYNYRLSNLLAAIGRAQLQRLPAMRDRRLAINAKYRAAFAAVEGITMMPVPEWSAWNGWLTCVLFDDLGAPERVRLALESADIESRPLWKPMHLQPVFSSCAARVDGTSERLFGHGLCLPSGSVMSDADVDRVSEIVVTSLREDRVSARP